ncbi:MAG: hypothetical protein R3A52_05480 [Polyangiales bacterium]
MPLDDGTEQRSPAATRSAVQVLARNLVREMKRAGWSKAEMLSLASEILAEVTRELRAAPPRASNPPPPPSL